MRQIRIKVLLAAALCAAVPAVAHASQARVDALGLQSDYLQDYVNVIHYPSSLVRYQNVVYGDLGIKNADGNDLPDFQDPNLLPPELDNSARSLGAYLKLWKNMPGVFGIQFNENANPVSPAYGADYYNRNRNESLVLLWAKDFGGVTLGAQFNRASSTLESGGDAASPFNWTPPGVVTAGLTSRDIMNLINASLGLEPRNSWGFGVGASFDWNAYNRRHTADLAVQYRSLDLNIVNAGPTGSVTIEDNGNYSLALNGRAQLATSDNTYLTPVVNYWRTQLGTQRTSTANPASNYEYDNTVEGWSVGLAEQWVLRENDLVVLGFSFGQQQADYEDSTALGSPFSATYSQLPALFAAAEVRPWNWLAVRMGAGKSWTSKIEYENVTTGETITIKDAPFLYALGLGFRLGGRLDLDAVLNQDFPFTGAWASSGQTEQPFSRLSATYRF